MIQTARPSHVKQQYITALVVLHCRNTMITRRPGTASIYDDRSAITTLSGRTASPALTNDDTTID